MKTMKTILLTIGLLITTLTYGGIVLDTTITPYQTYETSLLDSLSFFSIVDSLKLDEHTEFAVSEIVVQCNTESEMDFILTEIYVNKRPDDYVLMYSNETFYPLSIYINEGTDKKYNKKYFYISYDETMFSYIIYYLRPLRV